MTNVHFLDHPIERLNEQMVITYHLWTFFSTKKKKRKKKGKEKLCCTVVEGMNWLLVSMNLIENQELVQRMELKFPTVIYGSSAMAVILLLVWT